MSSTKSATASNKKHNNEELPVTASIEKKLKHLKKEMNGEGTLLLSPDLKSFICKRTTLYGKFINLDVTIQSSGKTANIRGGIGPDASGIDTHLGYQQALAKIRWANRP